MNWDSIHREVLAVTEQVFGSLQSEVARLAGELSSRLAAGNKIMVCGNGGSAADAQHLAGELVNRFLKERRPYAGLALSTDTSVMTSIGNDYGYDHVFEKQVQALGKPGDALIAISTSGNAENVCRAVQAAKGGSLFTVALTGGDGGRLAGLADRVLSISCTRSVPRIQEGHQLLIHLLCERLEETLG